MFMSKQQNCMPGGAGGGLSCTCLQQEDLMKRGRELQLLNYSRTLQIYIYIYIYIYVYIHIDTDIQDLSVIKTA